MSGFRLNGALALMVLCSSLPLSSHAAPVPVQLRFAVTPVATDPVWTTPGMTFEKKGECAYSEATRPLAAWPVARPLASGGAKAPLFNPGFPKPDGTYAPGTADDGFNTLFYPIEPAPGAKSVICRGTILADGVDVTAETPTRDVATTVQAINASGPPTVSPKLDPAKLPGASTSASAPKPATPSVVTVNQGKLIRESSGKLDSSEGRADFESGLFYSLYAKHPSAGDPDVVYDSHAGAVPGSIVPAPGAQFAVGLAGSATPRGYIGCKNRNYDPSAPKTHATRDLYYCLRTPEGHIAEVYCSSAWTAGPPFVLVKYWVWE